MYEVFRAATMLLLGYSCARRYDILKLNPINPKSAAKIKDTI